MINTNIDRLKTDNTIKPILIIISILTVLAIIDYKIFHIATSMIRVCIAIIFVSATFNGLLREKDNYMYIIAYSYIFIIILQLIHLTVGTNTEYDYFFECGIPLVENITIYTYLKIGDKNKLDLVKQIISYLAVFILLYIFDNILWINQKMIYHIALLVNIFIAIINLYNIKIKENELVHLNLIKKLYKIFTIYLFITTIDNLMYTFKPVKVLDIIVNILFIVYTYYIYESIVKTAIEYPYIELNENNKTLRKQSELLNSTNKLIYKHTEVQKKIKFNLNSREILLKSALDILPTIWIFFDENFNIINMNKAGEKTFGNNLKSINEIIYLVEEKDKFKLALDSVEYMDSLNNEFKIKDKIYIISFTKNDAENKYMITFIDITKEKVMEKNLLEINKLYENTINNIPAPIFIRENKLKLLENKVIGVNKAYEDAFGYLYSEVNGLNTQDYIAKITNDRYNKEDLEKFVNNMMSLDKNAIFEMVDKYNNHRYIEFNKSDYTKDNEKHTIIVYKDITDDQNMLNKIRKIEKLYKSLLDSVPEAISVENIDKGKIIYCNDKYEELLKNKRKINSFEINKICIPFNFEGRESNLTIYQDLEEKQKAEEIKNQLKQRIKYDNMKIEFFANMSHELKTPLNNIYSSTQLMKMLYQNNKIKDNNNILSNHIRITTQNLRRLLRLVDNILDISQVEFEFYKLNFKKFDIVNLTEEITDSVRTYSLSKNIDLIFDTNEEEQIVILDPDTIERIVLNLLSNSIKFTQPGGTIHVNVYSNKGYVSIEVKDNGCGIPKEKINEIFNRFSQVDNSLYKNLYGSGIGLSLIKSLIEMQGGNISINSEIDKGTSIFVTFPIKTSGDNAIKYVEVCNPNVEKIKIEFFDIYKA